MQKFQRNILAATLAAMTFGGQSALAEEATSFVDAMKNGKTQLSFRFRIENVADDSDAKEDSTAQTLKTRLNYQSGSYEGFSSFIEFDQVSELIEVDYHTGAGDGNFTDTATIADPEGTDLNQAYVQYAGNGTTVKYGRQRILLDGQRFVGGVGWRQNEQTYDALSVKNSSVEGLDIFYAYIQNVNRIFGDDRAPGDSDHETHLLNVKYKVSDAAVITPYAYLIENDGELPPLMRHSSDTYGVSVNGKIDSFKYLVEYATQSNAGDNPVEYTAAYTHLQAAYSVKPVTITGGYEILGADGDGYFVTPLATLHKYQGWSDVFLGNGAQGAAGTGNIAGGIEDMYLSVGGKFGPVKASVVYHTYESNDADAAGHDGDLGSEYGFTLGGKAGPVGLLLKYTSYSAGDNNVSDVSKLWLQASTAF